MTTPEDNSGLEHSIDRVLRALPLRRAPATLEERVMRGIARRQWWTLGFAHWPLTARALFLVGSCGFVPLTLWAIAGLRASAPTVAQLPSLTHLIGNLGVTGSVARDLWLLAQRIPPHWLEVTLVLGGSLYVALFALSAIAYRTLYTNEQPSP